MEQLAHVCFRDVTWLQHFLLTESTVLEYFSLCQFYDRTCNNEVLKMQARYTENEAILQQLHQMTGIEYALYRYIPPSLFIIVKQNRISPTRANILSSYYVLDGSVYMVPSLHSVLSSRLTSSMHHINEAIRYGAKHISFDPVQSRYVVDSSAENTNCQEEHVIERIVMDALAIEDPHSNKT